MSGTIVDFLENALDATVPEIEELVRTSPDTLLRQRENVLALLEDTWSGASLVEQRRREETGQLWPVMPRSAPNVINLVRTIFASGARYGAALRSAQETRREMQSLLLYAHGVHVPNPLLFRSASDAENSREFLRALSEICALAPLITGKVIRVFEPPPSLAQELTPDVKEALGQLAGHIGVAMMSYEDNKQMHQGHLREAADILLERSLEHLADLAGREEKREGSLLFPTKYDNPAIAAVIANMGEKLFGTNVSSAELNPHQVKLNQLIQLSLPGLAKLDLSNMVNIRDDESFGRFRATVSAALRETDSDVRGGRIATAQRTVAEHMDAGLAQLNARTRRGVLGDAVIGASIGWGLGAVLTSSVSGLRDLVMALIGNVLGDVTRNWPTPGEQSLRSHYVELGTASLVKRSNEQIDFTDFKTSELDGPKRRGNQRSANHQAIVESLLNDLSLGDDN